MIIREEHWDWNNNYMRVMATYYAYTLWENHLPLFLEVQKKQLQFGSKIIINGLMYKN